LWSLATSLNEVLHVLNLDDGGPPWANRSPGRCGASGSNAVGSCTYDRDLVPIPAHSDEQCGVVCSGYLLGHLVFLLGSWLDEFYDWARRYTLNTQIVLLARRDRLLPWLVGALIWMVFKVERNLPVNRAVKIKELALGSLDAKDSINTFQWCKALLNVESPPSLAVVQRMEADSKFFRSFAVVLVLILLIWPWQHRWPIAGVPVLLALLLLALWRYMEQRFKSINQTYWSVITLTARDGKVQIHKDASMAGSPSHAGGVVFRTFRDKTQYLLVEAKDDPDQWVLPKGHIEEREDYRETAAREVREETGVWAGIGVIPPPPKTLPGIWFRTRRFMKRAVGGDARQAVRPTHPGTDEEERSRRRIAADLGSVPFSVNSRTIIVRFFLMQALGCGLREDKTRQSIWLPLKQAVKQASHPETQELLKVADQRRSSIASALDAVPRASG
jgi:8-oxo-dGTP pyrophosphatase MutT (NUDIX family)